jgi:hypothetical protein
MTFFIHSKKFGRHEVIIDDEDWVKIKKFTWYILYNKNKNRSVKCVSTNDREGNIKLHKLVTGYKLTDHINGNPLDNRKSNLRDCSHAENMRNRGLHANNSSGFKGVSFHIKSNKFQVNIRIGGKPIYLGLYTHVKDAARAYNKAALKYHGEFARLNII